MFIAYVTHADGHNSGFRVNGTFGQQQAFFNFLVQPPEKKPPAIVNNEAPAALESLGKHINDAPW